MTLTPSDDDRPTSSKDDSSLNIEPPTASEYASADNANYNDDAQDEEESTRSSRPRVRIAAIVSAILALVVVGSSLGFIFANRSVGGGSGSGGGGSSSADAIAKVGETVITRREFERNYEVGIEGQEVMDQLIQIELLVQEAKRDGIEINQTEVDAQIEQIRIAQAGGDQERFLDFLKSVNIDSENDLRDLLGRQQYIQAMILKHTTMEQARSRHILLSGDTEEAIAARQAEAEALLAEVQAGGDFAALAKEKSDDPGSKENGGDLGWVPRGVFVPEFEEAIFSMQPNEFRLVKSQFGWHIIQLQDAAQMRQLESQDFLQTPSGQQAFADTFLPWIEGLQKKAVEDKQVVIYIQPDELVKAIPTPTPAPPVPTPAP